VETTGYTGSVGFNPQNRVLCSVYFELSQRREGIRSLELLLERQDVSAVTAKTATGHTETLHQPLAFQANQPPRPNRVSLIQIVPADRELPQMSAVHTALQTA
jgi:hypothetical protein